MKNSKAKKKQEYEIFKKHCPFPGDAWESCRSLKHGLKLLATTYAGGDFRLVRITYEEVDPMSLAVIPCSSVPEKPSKKQEKTFWGRRVVANISKTLQQNCMENREN